MKKLITLVLALFIYNLSLNIDNCSAQWAQYSNGIGTYNVISFVLNGNTLYAGSEGQNSGPGNGVYFSNNYGTNWNYSGLSPYNVQCLAVSGTNIFAGTRTAGVFLSTNNGGSWTAVNNGLTQMRVQALTVSGNYIFAGCDNGAGVFRSTNNGANWSSCGLTGLGVFSFAVNGSNLFAGTNTGISLSTNNGGSWTQTSPPPVWVRSIVISGTKIFAGGDAGGVYLSTNNGGNWTVINSGFPAGDVTSVAIIGSNLLAGIDYPNTYWGVYFSSNNGSTWITKNDGFTWSPAPPICAFIIINNYIFAGTGGQVWRRPLSDFIGIKQISEVVPSKYSLEQNYPNPFNPTTNIRYELPKNGFIRFVVFDMLGREVETLVNEKQTPGTYEVTFDASKYSSGVYYYKLITDGFSETKKMILIK